jgi:anaerobic ribonucleoside-triphosphate reductase activating protein
MQGRIARICTSFIDYPGKIAIAIYFAGCSIRCPGCQNKELWKEQQGNLMTTYEIIQKIHAHPLATAVVFLGGEPTDQLDFLKDLCTQITATCDKDIALYTGREFEVLPQDLLQHLQVIVCGPYRSELHVNGWPASTNQRVFKREVGQWKC